MKNQTLKNKYQEEHVNGDRNVYHTIEAYAEEWVHEVDKDGMFTNAYPKKNTKRRQDLPSLADQWREDWRKRKNK